MIFDAVGTKGKFKGIKAKKDTKGNVRILEGKYQGYIAEDSKGIFKKY